MAALALAIVAGLLVFASAMRGNISDVGNGVTDAFTALAGEGGSGSGGESDEPVPDADGVAFAVYSADDQSLDFYKRDSLRSSMAAVADSVQDMFSSSFSGVADDSIGGGGGSPAPAKTAFAVYSADDGSLCFYKRATPPAVGDKFNGKTATEVYTGFENDNPQIDPYRRGYFHDREDEIETVEVVDMGIRPISCEGWFAYMAKLRSFDIKNLDLSACRSMQYMFVGCQSLEAADLSHLYTPELVDIGGIFESCTSLERADVDGWHAPNLYNAWFSFFNNALTSLDLSGFRASPVNVDSMLAMNRSLESVELGGKFGLTRASNVRALFDDCRSLAHVDLSCLRGSSPESAEYMFSNCYSLEEIGSLEDVDFSGCSKADSMFRDCVKLASLDLSGFGESHPSSAAGMFSNCSNLLQVSVESGWNWSPEMKLPSPSGEIPGSDGKWYALSDGTGYAPGDVPSGVQDTYFATKALRDAEAEE